MLSSVTLSPVSDVTYMRKKEPVSTMLYTDMEEKQYLKLQICFAAVNGRFANGFRVATSCL